MYFGHITEKRPRSKDTHVAREARAAIEGGSWRRLRSSLPPPPEHLSEHMIGAALGSVPIEPTDYAVQDEQAHRGYLCKVH